MILEWNVLDNRGFFNWHLYYLIIIKLIFIPIKLIISLWWKLESLKFYIVLIYWYHMLYILILCHQVINISLQKLSLQSFFFNIYISNLKMNEYRSKKMNLHSDNIIIYYNKSKKHSWKIKERKQYVTVLCGKMWKHYKIGFSSIQE